MTWWCLRSLVFWGVDGVDPEKPLVFEGPDPWGWFSLQRSIFHDGDSRPIVHVVLPYYE